MNEFKKNIYTEEEKENFSEKSSENEILDVYNEDGEVIGQCTRGEVHKKGLLHKVIHCWFEEEENGKKYYYFQQRAMFKSYPGLYGVMVGGHIDSGEDEYIALKREIEEEAGIKVEDERIEFIGEIVEHIKDGDFIDNEICEVYKYKRDKNMSFNPNAEVGKIVRIEETDYKRCIFGASETTKAEVIEVSNQDNMEIKRPGDIIYIRTDEFCEYDKRYIKFVTKMSDDEFFMWEALAEARTAFNKRETAIGAVIVKDGEIIGRGHNLTETLQDSTAHSEIVAIKEAAKNLGGWRLSGCTLYVTMEPCIMCCGAIVNSRIRDVVIGARRVKNAKVEKQSDFKKEFFDDSKVEYKYGILEEECAGILKEFFDGLRKIK